ncbi:hypothetical protein Pcinc_026319 [Petrolisthes cinctipes]|uniref:Uncharacterized protein n=1 Tax=Petrolisthes cinctipes TaxID=88211 RepID=A0AAE1F8N2_PETCI|nr:hypothetical protein Pcinc_026319 [Petrolisthes cinctipes]
MKCVETHEKHFKHQLIVQNQIEAIVLALNVIGHSLEKPVASDCSLEAVEILEEELEDEFNFNERSKRTTFIYDTKVVIQLREILSQAQGKEQQQQPKMSFSQFYENIKQNIEKEKSCYIREDEQNRLEHKELGTQQNDISKNITPYSRTEKLPHKLQNVEGNDNGILEKQSVVMENNTFDEFNNPSKRIKIKHEPEWLQEQQTMLPDIRFHCNRRKNGTIKRRMYPGRVIVSKRKHRSYRDIKLHHGLKVGHNAFNNSQISSTLESKQATLQRPPSPYYPHALLSKPEELYPNCVIEDVFSEKAPKVTEDVTVPHALYKKSGNGTYVDLDKPSQFYSFDINDIGDITTTTLDSIPSAGKFNFNESCVSEEMADFFSVLSDCELLIDNEESLRSSVSHSFGNSSAKVTDLGRNVLDSSSSINTPQMSPVPERSPDSSDMQGWLNPFQYYYNFEDKELDEWWSMGSPSHNK